MLVFTDLVAEKSRKFQGNHPASLNTDKPTAASTQQKCPPPLNTGENSLLFVKPLTKASFLSNYVSIEIWEAFTGSSARPSPTQLWAAVCAQPTCVENDSAFPEPRRKPEVSQQSFGSEADVDGG